MEIANGSAALTLRHGRHLDRPTFRLALKDGHGRKANE
jgi:hypothetical protein